MKEIIFIVEEAQEGGFTAKSLGDNIFTEADTLSELKAMIKDAVICHFEKDTRNRPGHRAKCVCHLG